MVCSVCRTTFRIFRFWCFLSFISGWHFDKLFVIRMVRKVSWSKTEPFKRYHNLNANLIEFILLPCTRFPSTEMTTTGQKSKYIIWRAQTAAWCRSAGIFSEIKIMIDFRQSKYWANASESWLQNVFSITLTNCTSRFSFAARVRSARMIQMIFSAPNARK